MNFVLTLNHSQTTAIFDYYRDISETSSSPYVLAVIKEAGVTMTLYKTNKVMFQGKNAEQAVLFWEEVFGIRANPSKSKPLSCHDYYRPSIGSDESGVGDFFGPLTVCAVYLSKEQAPLMKKLGVKDSKLLTDDNVTSIAKQLIRAVPYSLLVLKNAQYNTLIEKGFNANKLKAHMHAQCHAHVLNKIAEKPLIVVDQFCTPTHYLNYVKDFKQAPKVDVFETKAESHYASVAAASIIARYSYLEHLESLGKPLGIRLKKGASAEVDAQAARIIENHGIETLNRFAKVHFKTTKKAESLTETDRGLDLGDYVDADEQR